MCFLRMLWLCSSSARSLLILKMTAKCSTVSLHDLDGSWLSNVSCIGAFVGKSLLGRSGLSSSSQNFPHFIPGSSALGSVELLQQSNIRGGSSSSTRQLVMPSSQEFKGILVLSCVICSPPLSCK
jgi:hypothetical protein